MAKLTKAQRNELLGILKDVEWTNAFISDGATVVARECRPDDCTAYVVGNTGALSPAAGTEKHGAYPHLAVRAITKDIGSPLCGLPRGSANLARFIDANS